MVRVLIVDDEILVRLGLHASLDWEGCGYRVVAEATDGVDALEMCEKYRPQLVLTDLKMPRMDGITLMERLRERYPDTKVIVLTCHEEFALARKALQLGAVDYLLKVDIVPEAFSATLKSLRERFWSGQEPPAPGGSEDSLRIFRCIQTLVEGGRSEEELAALVEASGLALPARGLVVLYAQIDSFQRGGGEESPIANQALYDSVQSLLWDCVRKFAVGEVVTATGGRLVALVSFGEQPSALNTQQQLSELLGFAMESVKRTLGVTISVGVSDIHTRYTQIPKGCNEAEYALNMRFFGGRDELIYFSGLQTQAAGDGAGPVPVNMEEIRGALRRGGHAELRELIGGVRRICREGGFTDREVRIFFCRMAFECIDYIQTMGGDYRDAFGDVHPVERVMELGTLEDILRYWEQVAEAIPGLIGRLRERQKNALIGKAVEYIDANYHREIPLEEIARHISLNAAYFCKLFKKVKGVTFVEYLTERRISEAKRLLESTGLRTYDIAERVGYGNPEYFSRLFKRATGLTPMQYRARE